MKVGADKNVLLVSPYRMRVFLRAILTTLCAGLLLLAVLTLFKLQPQTPEEVQRKGNFQILAVFLFTLTMSVMCNILTKAKTQEIFMATAAFAAVLVAFMANSTNVVMTPNE